MLKSRLWEVNLWLTATLCIFCAGFFLHWEVSRSFSCWKITHLKNQKTADCCRSGVSIFTSYWREEICGFSLKVTFFCFLFPVPDFYILMMIVSDNLGCPMQRYPKLPSLLAAAATATKCLHISLMGRAMIRLVVHINSKTQPVQPVDPVRYE